MKCSGATVTSRLASKAGFAAPNSGWAALLLALGCRGSATEAPEPPAPRPEPPQAAAAADPRSRPALRPVARSLLCASLGTLRRSPSGLFGVDDPKLRATVAGSLGHGLGLSFRYLGSTARQARLRSGRERRQLGLELLARDTCNLLYVMWRIEPVSELVVSVKSNASQSTHAECENRGYHALRPVFSSPLPTLAPGAEHRLRAEIVDGALSVHVDGGMVWRGPLDASARELGGRSGLRSDNARFEVLELHADMDESSERSNTDHRCSLDAGR